jgi:aspartyl-tRNA(Asn)/glutamyl-tRNA(Gln) amidotransferase subunit B
MEKEACAPTSSAVRRPGERLGTRCEIKNVNSIRFIGQAVEHEARRQIEIIEEGGSIDQETRLFDRRAARHGRCGRQRRGMTTATSRSRPVASAIRRGLRRGTEEEFLPELPDEKKMRFIREFSLSAYDAGVLVAERETAEYFEGVESAATRRLPRTG